VSDSKLLEAKISARSLAVDKVVHNLFIAARNWLVRSQNLQINFYQQPSCEKTRLESFAARQNFACFLGVVRVKFINIFHNKISHRIFVSVRHSL
jgi:hypothetical protein